MIGGVFLLARDPEALAGWYREHLGWQFQVMQEEETRYVELYYREVGRPDTPQHLVYAIMPSSGSHPVRGRGRSCPATTMWASTSTTLRTSG